MDAFLLISPQLEFVEQGQKKYEDWCKTYMSGSHLRSHLPVSLHDVQSI